MTRSLNFQLVFPKFSNKPLRAVFQPGLNIVYGESGTGKSDLIRQLIDLPVKNEINFSLIEKAVPPPFQIILQNPDNQIICSTIARELAFSIECNHDDQQIIQRNFQEACSLLPESINLKRHPSTLSGGEKEILNVITAISAHPKTLLIDDGLSFLSNASKDRVVELLRRLIDESGTIIIWFTSEPGDCRYGDALWRLSLSGFDSIENLAVTVYPERSIQPGNLKLEISSLLFAYNKHETLFNNLNYRIDSCRSFGVVGINGSGKTTLARMILGISTPTEGTINLNFNDGRTTLSTGYLDQFPEHMLGYGTLGDFAVELIRCGMLKENRFHQCQRRMQDYQLSWDLLNNRNFHTISWSTLRIALVFLLTHCDYDIIVLDEPSFGLGRKQRLRLINYLFEYLNSNHLIIISHDHDLINCLCDHSINLNEQLESKVQEVVNDHAD